MSTNQIKLSNEVPNHCAKNFNWICWKFDWGGKVFKASATNCQLTDNKKLIIDRVSNCHQIESLKNFYKTNCTWPIAVLYILRRL